MRALLKSEHVLPVSVVLWSAALCSALGCSSGAEKDNARPASSAASTSGVSSASTLVSAGGSASAAPAAIASAAPVDPVCKVANQKVWASNLNKLTGLTVKRFDEKKYGLGYASGLTPEVLVVGVDAQISKVKVDVKAGSKFSKAPSNAEGSRVLWRVTPVSVEGTTAKAFVDYRDEFKDKRRHVACGPADSDEEFISFDGVPYLDRTPTPTDDERKKVFAGKEGYVELRDCRTFITRQSKEIWAVGSELHGVENKEGKIDWTSTLVIDFGAKEREIVLHESKLKGEPPRVAQYEIPVSRRIEDKGYLLATRYASELFVAVLDQNKKLKGKISSYKGFPQLPDIARVGNSQVITVAVANAPGVFSLKSLTVPMDTLELPASYSDVHVDDNTQDAETEPELFVDKKGQRWLSYIEGHRDKGHLELIPLDEKMSAAGRVFQVTQEQERASEARMFPLDNGAILIAFLRDTDGKTELVTEELSCEVKQ